MRRARAHRKTRAGRAPRAPPRVPTLHGHLSVVFEADASSSVSAGVEELFRRYDRARRRKTRGRPPFLERAVASSFRSLKK